VKITALADQSGRVAKTPICETD